MLYLSPTSSRRETSPAPRKSSMQTMDGGRRGVRRLKDRLAWLSRPANSLLRSPCSSSSSTSTFATTAAATTISTSPSSTATTASFLPSVEPFSAALDLLRHPHSGHSKSHKQTGSSSTRHARRRHFKNVHDKDVIKLSSNPYGFTTTDDDDDDDEIDGEDDMEEAFLSSRSQLVSSDFSGFYASKNLPPKHRTSRRHQQRQEQMRHQRRRPASCLEACRVSDEEEVGFRPVVTTAEEEVRKGLAVVKRSRDPYGDFRESMVEMIVERQVFGAAELEGLLRSYLSLNAPRLHPVILQAFSDIWVVLRGG